MLLCVKVITAGDSYGRRLLISQCVCVCVCVCVVKLGELPGVLLELQYRSITYTTMYEVYYSPEAQQAKSTKRYDGLLSAALAQTSHILTNVNVSSLPPAGQALANSTIFV